MPHSDPQGLRIVPFRGLRFDPGQVRDPAAVTSPPYDMIGPEEAQRLADTEEHNVVRLILPAPGERDPGSRYRRAATSLKGWIGAGALKVDDERAFYVYEQSGHAGRQRGLVCLVRLDQNDTMATRTILPHEAVVEAVVDDRLAQMIATDANIEPILLTYTGDGAASDAVDRAADTAEPLSTTTTGDGVCHRLWAITAAEDVDAVAADILTRRALIADGHHRHAAYLRLRAHLGDDEAAEYGLALLVDTVRYPLTLHAIHRVLPNLPLDEAVQTVRPYFTVTAVDLDPTEPLRALDTVPADRPAFLLSGATGAFLLTEPHGTALDAAIPADRPAAWRGLDATALHYLLVETIWKLPDTYEEVRFDHSPGHAVAHAAAVDGTAVLLRPTTEAVVRELAASGVLMPRKSTAFGPKPATGLVMRLLHG